MRGPGREGEEEQVRGIGGGERESRDRWLTTKFAEITEFGYGRGWLGQSLAMAEVVEDKDWRGQGDRGGIGGDGFLMPCR